MQNTRLIALDADGVLIDYHEGYAQAWERAFGHRPALRNAEGYHPMDYWNVPTLNRKELEHLRLHGFTEQTWRNMPAIPGAVAACRELQQAGYSLVCVTALEPSFEEARTYNLRTLGFHFDSVHAVGARDAGNPKRERIKALKPAAFVDDYLGFLQNLPPNTWRALIRGRPHNSPNLDRSLSPPDSTHVSLAEFSKYWLTRALAA
jgi:phosphoglycolate phosphatase-like HAD superfamily hydrolase